MPGVVRVTQTGALGHKPPVFTFGPALPVPGRSSHWRQRNPVSAKPERPTPEKARLAHHACSRAALTPKRGNGSLLVGRNVTRYLPNATEDQLVAASSRRPTRAAPGTGREVTQQAVDTDQSPKGWRVTTGSYAKLTPSQGSREAIGRWGCSHPPGGRGFSGQN